jgi:hypothetical protein
MASTIDNRGHTEEDIEIWTDFMVQRGWRDRSSAVVAEYKRLRGGPQTVLLRHEAGHHRRV